MQTALVIVLGIIVLLAIWAFFRTNKKLKNARDRIKEQRNELDDNKKVFNLIDKLNDEHEEELAEKNTEITKLSEFLGKKQVEKENLKSTIKEKSQKYLEEIANLNTEIKQLLEIQKQKHTKYYFFSPQEKAAMQKHNVKKYGVYYRKFVKVEGKTIEFTTALGTNDVDVPHYSDSVLVTHGVFDEVAVPYDAHGQEIKDREVYQSWITDRLKMFEESALSENVNEEVEE
jgi:cell division protein FtsL